MQKTTDIVRPESALPVTEEELKKTKHGNIELKTRKEFLDKATCQRVADELLKRGSVTGMTALEIAQEIYAHAYVCFKWSFIQNVPNAKDIYERAKNGITIDDGGDTAVRKVFYSFVWNSLR